jgi:hypothetical protein
LLGTKRTKMKVNRWKWDGDGTRKQDYHYSIDELTLDELKILEQGLCFIKLDEARVMRKELLYHLEE